MNFVLFDGIEAVMVLFFDNSEVASPQKDVNYLAP